MYWVKTLDGDGFARLLADRHYSRKSKGANLFVGPGEKMVLVTLNYDALFVWRKALLREDNQKGVECALFRNESDVLSSELIREAVGLAFERWHGERLFTYVADAKVRSVNPGCCFMKAGWRRCGRNKDGRLTILEFC